MFKSAYIDEGDHIAGGEEGRSPPHNHTLWLVLSDSPQSHALKPEESFSMKVQTRWDSYTRDNVAAST